MASYTFIKSGLHGDCEYRLIADIGEPETAPAQPKPAIPPEVWATPGPVDYMAAVRAMCGGGKFPPSGD